MRYLTAIGLAVVIAAVAFVFRFNTLGGTLGGFDNDEFAHLLRSQALLRGEQPLRDFADAELRGAWPALSYAVPAWAQQVWGRTLLAEAYLTAGALAVAYAALFLTGLLMPVARHRIAIVAAVAGATLAIATMPKLYNYPKVVALAFGAAAITWAMRDPTAIRLGVAAVVTAAAALFRHDYGVYLAMAMMAGLLVRDAGHWRDVRRRLTGFAALTAIVLLPSAIWVQLYQGLVPYLLNALRTSTIETERTPLTVPPLVIGAPFDVPSAIALTYYAFWAIPATALLLLGWRWLRGNDISPAERGTAAALIVLAATVNVFFLRSNLGARFGDAVVPIALLAVWIAGSSSSFSTPLSRSVIALVPITLLLVLIPCAYAYAELAPELRESRLGNLTEVGPQFRTVRAALQQMPPTQWSEELVEGRLRASQYIAVCTNPDDRVLVAAYAPEVMVLANRGFAGGQPTVSLGFYVSDAEQRATLARWKQQSVPVVLASEGYETEFETDYPLLAAHVADRYHEAGVIPLGEGAHFRVFVENTTGPHRIDPRFGLPCFR